MHKKPKKKISLDIKARLTKKELRYVKGGGDHDRLYDSQNRFYFY